MTHVPSDKRYFDETKAGCYVDGAHGDRGLRQHLALMMEDLGCNDVDLLETLEGEGSDDGWEVDASLEILRENTAEGLEWTLEAGDLVLRREE